MALYLEPAHPDASDTCDYEMCLSVELTQALGFPVDVPTLDQVPLGFQDSAIKVDLVLVRAVDQLSDHLEGIARRYLEFAPLGRAYLPEVLRV